MRVLSLDATTALGLLVRLVVVRRVELKKFSALPAVGGCFFFFQAEDGIRDVAVTGVQTCALPISTRESTARGTGGPAPAQSRSTAARTESTCSSPTRAGILFYGCWCRTIPRLQEEEMERTPRFAVAALGAVTVSIVVGVPRKPRAIEPAPLSGQAAPAVIWHFDSLPPGQPPAGFSFGHTGGGRGGPWIVQSGSQAPSPPNVP